MIVEYALAQLWISWGVVPQALAGHSMGENTAACLSGVIGFEDCIALVELRGRLFDRIAPGGMLSVPLPAAELMAEAGDDLDLACDNAPGLSVVSGPRDRIDALQATLVARGIDCQRVAIDIAAHSRMLEPILPEFEAFLRSIPLSAPSIPILSNRTGTWMTDAQATDPRYWVDHLRNHVDFAGCIATLREDPARLFVEVGPGRAMSALAQANGAAPDRVISTLRHPDHAIEDDAFFLNGVRAAFGHRAGAGLVADLGRGSPPGAAAGLCVQSERYFIEPASSERLLCHHRRRTAGHPGITGLGMAPVLAAVGPRHRTGRRWPSARRGGTLADLNRRDRIGDPRGTQLRAMPGTR